MDNVFSNRLITPEADKPRLFKRPRKEQISKEDKNQRRCKRYKETSQNGTRDIFDTKYFMRTLCHVHQKRIE